MQITPLSRRAALRLSGASLLAGSAALALSSCSDDAPTDEHGAPQTAHETDDQHTSSSTPSSQAPKPSASPAAPGKALFAGRPVPEALVSSSAKGALVAGPHLALLTRAETLPTLSSRWQSSLGEKVAPTAPDLPAAEGEEWLVLQMTPSSPLIPTTKYKATATLTVGSTTVDVSGLLGGYDQYVGWRNKSVLVAVSVKKGATAVLKIAEQGKAASLTVPTMKLSQDAATASMMLSVRNSSVAIAPAKVTWKGGWSDGRNVEAMSMAFEFKPKSSFFTPWTAAQGWAAPGRMWFLLKYEVDYDSKLFTVLKLNLDKISGISTGRSVVRPKPAVLDTVKELTNFQDSTLIFDVPVGFTGGDFTLAMPSSIPIKYREGNTATVKLNSVGSSTVKTKITATWK